LEERQEAMVARLRELEASLDHQQELVAMAEGMESFCQRVKLGLEQATFEHRRQLIELLLDRVIVTQDEVEIRYVIPTSPQGEYSRFYQLRIAYCRAIPPLAWSGVLAGPPARHPCRGF
jgi:site-specific DNA recombinase